MAWIEKISDKEIKEKGVSALSDRPNLNNAYGAGGLTAKQLKEWFDQLAKLIILKQNDIIDKTDPAEYAPNLPLEGLGPGMTLQKFVEQLLNGELANSFCVNVEGFEEGSSLESVLGSVHAWLNTLDETIEKSLQKDNSTSSVYATDNNGEQTLLKYAWEALGSVLVQRTSDGDVIVDTPKRDDGAVNKEYVDAGLDNKADKIHSPSKVYTTNKEGVLNPVDLVSTPSNGAIPFYFGECLRTGTPLSDTDSINFGYAKANIPSYVAVSMSEDGDYVLRLSLVNKNGEIIPNSESLIDLPLEMAFVGAALVKDEDGNEFVEFALQNGEKLRVGLSEIFNGKVDKVTKAGKWVYTTEEGVQTIRRVGTTPTSWNIPWFDENNNLKSSTPVADLDVTNKQYVDDGLAGRVPTTEYQYKLYGTRGLNSETGKVNQSYFSMLPVGSEVGAVVNWQEATRSNEFVGKEPTCTIGVSDPIYPIQAANMRYVDGKVNPIASDVEDLKKTVGVKYKLHRETYTSVPAVIPDNAMPYAYISKLSPYLPDPEVTNKFVSTPTNIGDYDYLTYDAASNVFTIDTAGSKKTVTHELYIDPVNIGSAREVYVSIELVSGTLPADFSVSFDYVDLESGDLTVFPDDVVYIAVGETHRAASLTYSDIEGDLTLNTLSIGTMGRYVWDNVQLRISISTDTPSYDYNHCLPLFVFVDGGIRGGFNFLQGITYNGYMVADLSMIHEGERVYNYMDFEAKEYVVRCYRESENAVVLAEEEIRIPITEDINPGFSVIAGGEVDFSDEPTHLVIPTNNIMCEIAYVLDRGATS